MLIAGPTEILDRGQQAGREDAQRRRHAAASDGLGARRDLKSPGRRPPPTGARIRAARPARSVTLSPGAARLPPAASHRADRRAADQMPAARRLQRKDAGHGRRDRERAGWNLQPRRLPPRQRELRRQIAQIGLARQEAEHVDVIGDRAVPLDHLGRRKAGRGRRRRRDRAPGSRRSRPAAATAARPSSRSAGPASAERCVPERRRRQHQRIVVHQQRAEGRHALDHAVELRSFRRARQRQHPR